jgi:hypothetical protein
VDLSIFQNFFWFRAWALGQSAHWPWLPKSYMGRDAGFSDPARFSLAHGGKDRHPFPVPLRVYDETIRVLKSGVQKAKLGRTEEVDALKRLDQQARHVELR